MSQAALSQEEIASIYGIKAIVNFSNPLLSLHLEINKGEKYIIQNYSLKTEWARVQSVKTRQTAFAPLHVFAGYETMLHSHQCVDYALNGKKFVFFVCFFLFFFLSKNRNSIKIK